MKTEQEIISKARTVMEYMGYYNVVETMAHDICLAVSDCKGRPKIRILISDDEDSKKTIAFGPIPFLEVNNFLSILISGLEAMKKRILPMISERIEGGKNEA